MSVTITVGSSGSDGCTTWYGVNGQVFTFYRDRNNVLRNRRAGCLPKNAKTSRRGGLSFDRDVAYFVQDFSPVLVGGYTEDFRAAVRDAMKYLGG